METTVPNTPAPPSRDRRRIVMAILAAGSVLGIGAVATLAAWNDSEFATGQFATGQFDLEGSTDGAAFSSSPAAPGKTLTFELDSDLLTPDSVVYAPFAVQLSADSDYAADVTLASTGTGALAAGLTYSVYDVGTFGGTCSAATPPAGPAIVTNAPATSAAAPVFALTAAEDPTNLCFVVTAGATVDQGTDATITWEFVGTSTDPLP
jgi:predicted ribosomally synthesized peptide with SipW-like signal peptide